MSDLTFSSQNVTLQVPWDAARFLKSFFWLCQKSDIILRTWYKCDDFVRLSQDFSGFGLEQTWIWKRGQVLGFRCWVSRCVQGTIWCSFCYFVRNSLVALLEALWTRILSFRFVNIGFFLKCFSTFSLFVCVQGICLKQKPFFRPSQSGSCVCL